MARTGLGVRKPYCQQYKFTKTSNSYHQYVTLKMYITNAALGKHLNDELEMYQCIAKGPKRHPGRQAIRVDGLEEAHRCLFHPPLGDNLSSFLRRNPTR